MYKHIFGLFPKSLKGKGLAISGLGNFEKIVKEPEKLIEADYPDIDMQKLPYKNSSFDYVISDQVIEHLENPQKAIDESRRVLKKGGIAIHATCLLMPIHPCPEDYWRFTKSGLEYLCKDFSKIKDIGSWGNRIAVIIPFIWEKLRYLPVADSKFNPTNWIATWNEDDYPIVTWIVAKK